ncbi:hypothetical protein M5D96_003739 [Drosophila gunungcola]|uniref:Uncharacterized protein n=1 Tax=Drosophila gunungcola TaxID=103775 RepID=A0A9Q0BSD8_9MUSC|nr:hypothetical protein M5D96_003739 [Drosophila gunungcola]
MGGPQSRNAFANVVKESRTNRVKIPKICKSTYSNAKQQETHPNSSIWIDVKLMRRREGYCLARINNKK